MNEWYAGKEVVVTGCSSGMGAAVVEELLSAGAKVHGADLVEPASNLLSFTKLDLADEASVQDFVASTTQPLDGLFNVAGAAQTGSALSSLKINFLGSRVLTEGLVKRLRPGSAVVGVSSGAAVGFESHVEEFLDFVKLEGFMQAEQWLAKNPSTLEGRNAGYSFAKKCVVYYTMLRATSFGPRGIRINCIGPGVTASPFLEGAAVSVGQERLDTFPRPLGRDAAPSEQAKAMLFLNSGEASYVNGSLLWVDGGYSAGCTTGAFVHPTSH